MEKIFIDLFQHTLSVCFMILGRRDTGKTDFSLLIMEILEKFNLISNFATNINIYESPFDVKYITNLDDLEFWCRNTPGRKLFILDEAGTSLRRRSPMSKLNIKLLDNLQILRKYKLSLFLIAPGEKYIDSATLGSDVLDAVIVKPYPKNRKVALYQNVMEDEEIWITEIPSTHLKFNTWDVARFTMHGETTKPKFKDKDLEILWEWSHGKTHKALGIHPWQLNRIVRKYVKTNLEMTVHTTHNRDREAFTEKESSRKP